MSSIEAVSKRYSVLIYFTLVFVISWGGGFLILGPRGFPLRAEEFESLGGLLYAAILAGPCLAGILADGPRLWESGPPGRSHPAAPVAGRLALVRPRAATRSRDDRDSSAAIPRVLRFPPRHNRLQR